MELDDGSVNPEKLKRNAITTTESK